jgi:hypothetical protein
MVGIHIAIRVKIRSRQRMTWPQVQRPAEKFFANAAETVGACRATHLFLELMRPTAIVGEKK